MSHEINLTKDAKISFAKMQAGEYDEDAAQKKLEDPWPLWWNSIPGLKGTHKEILKWQASSSV